MKQILRLLAIAAVGTLLVFGLTNHLAANHPEDEFAVADELVGQLEKGKDTVRYFGTDYDEDILYRAMEARWPYAFTMRIRQNTVGWVEYTVDTEQRAAQEQAQSYARAVVQSLIPAGTEDTQKLRLLHDWLVTHCAYDSAAASNVKTTEGSTAPFTGVGALVDGKAVCAGYARAYAMLCQAADIPCVYVTSDEMNHGWNLVLVNGEMRYVDCTYDDPLPDRGDYALHDYFLVDEKTLAATHQWDRAFYGELTDRLWKEKK